ncbi:MAG TPA: hypothetical protein PLV13_09770 [Ilumatobacteraceae bacterium]|nr:hypothetical protein [Ilumatobacteraceae bacterium]
MTHPEGRHRFQTFWYGGQLTPYEQLCFLSFLDHGHVVELYSYDLDVVVPEGVVVRDAAEVLPADSVFVYEHDGFGKGSVSAFSNLFRYKLLRDRGGWWIDTDVVCLTSDIDDRGGEYYAKQDDELAAPGTMCFPAGSEVPTRCFEHVLALGTGVKWGDGGPRAFTDVLRTTGRLHSAAPASECYPVHFSEAVDLLRPSRVDELHSRLSSAMFLHLWNSTLVNAGVDKHVLPPKGSLLRQVADRHPVPGWKSEYDEHRFDRDVAHAEQVAQLRWEVAATRAELHAKQLEIDTMINSKSWRITRPLRRLLEAKNRRRRNG